MTTKPPRGFAAMSPERLRQVASMGGKAAQAEGRGYKWTSDTARIAGSKGGKATAARRNPTTLQI